MKPLRGNPYRMARVVREAFTVQPVEPEPELLAVAARIARAIREAEHDDPAATATYLRGEAITDAGTTTGAYHVGCAVADYLGVTNDYAIAAFARRFARGLLAATSALAGVEPVRVGDRLAWDDTAVTAVADAVGVLTRPAVRRG